MDDDNKRQHIAAKQIIISGDSSRIVTSFSPPLVFPEGCHYEMALARVETYYSFPNITIDNNKLRVSFDGGKTWKVIEIPVGCYEVYAINNELQRLIKEAGGEESMITISPNKNTLKCILKIKDKNYAVDFTIEQCIRSVLGFNAIKYDKTGRFEGQHIVNIMDVNSILVKCDAIGSSTLNGVPEPVLYSFFPNVPPGRKIVEVAHNLIYLPITTSSISSLSLWVTDQGGKEIDLRGEKLTLTLLIRSC